MVREYELDAGPITEGQSLALQIAMGGLAAKLASTVLNSDLDLSTFPEDRRITPSHIFDKVKQNAYFSLNDVADDFELLQENVLALHPKEHQLFRCASEVRHYFYAQMRFSGHLPQQRIGNPVPVALQASEVLSNPVGPMPPAPRPAFATLVPGFSHVAAPVNARDPGIDVQAGAQDPSTVNWGNGIPPNTSNPVLAQSDNAWLQNEPQIRAIIDQGIPSEPNDIFKAQLDTLATENKILQSKVETLTQKVETLTQKVDELDGEASATNAIHRVNEDRHDDVEGRLRQIESKLDGIRIANSLDALSQKVKTLEGETDALKKVNEDRDREGPAA